MQKKLDLLKNYTIIELCGPEMSYVHLTKKDTVREKNSKKNSKKERFYEYSQENSIKHTIRFYNLNTLVHESTLKEP